MHNKFTIHNFKSKKTSAVSTSAFAVINSLQWRDNSLFIMMNVFDSITSYQLTQKPVLTKEEELIAPIDVVVFDDDTFNPTQLINDAFLLFKKQFAKIKKIPNVDRFFTMDSFVSKNQQTITNPACLMHSITATHDVISATLFVYNSIDDYLNGKDAVDDVNMHDFSYNSTALFNHVQGFLKSVDPRLANMQAV